MATVLRGDNVSLLFLYLVSAAFKKLKKKKKLSRNKVIIIKLLTKLIISLVQPLLLVLFHCEVKFWAGE